VTELLIGLGLDELSMSAVTVPDVKVAVEATEYSSARERAEDALRVATRSELHETIQ